MSGPDSYFLRISTILFTGLLYCAGAAAAHLPEVTADGLHLVKQTDFGAVYLKPGAKLGQYDKVAVLECFVAFQRDWVQNMNAQMADSVTPEMVQKIKTTLAAQFMKVFKQQLSQAGYSVVDDAARDVLVLRPAIVNLQVQAPDPMSNPGVVYSQGAGQGTLYLELRDSVSSELLARVIDTEVAENLGGTFGYQDSTQNLVQADTILKKWADRLVQFLKAARSAG
jgi:Protein of unknown function (DUF3313)